MSARFGYPGGWDSDVAGKVCASAYEGAGYVRYLRGRNGDVAGEVLLLRAKVLEMNSKSLARAAPRGDMNYLTVLPVSFKPTIKMELGPPDAPSHVPVQVGP